MIWKPTYDTDSGCLVCQDPSSASTHSFATGWAVGSAGFVSLPYPSQLRILMISSHHRGADTSQLLRSQLKWLTTSYPSPGGIYITEFGFAEPVSVK